VFLALAMVAALGGSALADNDERTHGERLIVISDGDQEATITLDGSWLEVVARDGSDVSVHGFDFSELGMLIDDALDGAFDGFAVAMEDFHAEDIAIAMDDDHTMICQRGGAVHEYDLSEVSRFVETTLAEVMADLEWELEGRHDVHRHSEQSAEAELQAEIDELRAEIDRLRDDLQRLRWHTGPGVHEGRRSNPAAWFCVVRGVISRARRVAYRCTAEGPAGR
jgi:hypothetical protein